MPSSVTLRTNAGLPPVEVPLKIEVEWLQESGELPTEACSMRHSIRSRRTVLFMTRPETVGILQGDTNGPCPRDVGRVYRPRQTGKFARVRTLLDPFRDIVTSRGSPKIMIERNPRDGLGFQPVYGSVGCLNPDHSQFGSKQLLNHGIIWISLVIQPNVHH